MVVLPLSVLLTQSPFTLKSLPVVSILNSGVLFYTGILTKVISIVLDSVPTKPRNPWQLFLREHIKEYRDRGEKIDLKFAAKTFGDKWRALSESEKEVTYKKRKRRNQVY